LRDSAFLLLDIDLVAQHHKRKTIGVSGRRLDQELVAPAIERIERLAVVDIVHEHAAVGAAVEGHSEGLETFLAGGIPELVAALASVAPPRGGMGDGTCIVTNRSSTNTSFVRKSAPMVAL
jgi:histone H3/H4